MTDNEINREINRLVAERIMGWSIYHHDKDIAANCYYMLTDSAGDPVAAPDGWHTGERKTEAEAWADAPAYCTDPAAWGALLVWLASERLMPKLRWDEIDAQWVAQVGRSALYELGRDAHPGRALALAALRAYGVEV